MRRYIVTYTEGSYFEEEFRELVIANSFEQAKEKFMERMHYSGGTAEVCIEFIRVEY
jgi:hypothetical protein